MAVDKVLTAAVPSRRAAAAAVAAVLAAGLSTLAAAQVAPPQPPDPVQSEGDVGAGSPAPAALATPLQPRVEPSAEASAYAERPGPQCSDFQALPGASWRAVTSVRFPGPQGEIRIATGQTLESGAYVSGLDLSAILQSRCH